MAFRTVVISNRCKLDLKMGYLVVRGDETRRIFLDEISVLVLENSAISITGCLLEELATRKIKVIFCDRKRNPVSELIPYYGSFDSAQKIKAQISWTNEVKGLVWTEIVAEKIKKQAQLLLELGESERAQMLFVYVSELEFFDSTNREGHAAKVYFNAVFGQDFTRSDSTNVINSALNYGYAVLLSLINREISANGYLTQLGIFHDNMFNQFNLGCDLMEPFRVFVDRLVRDSAFAKFESDEKHAMLKLLNSQVKIDDCRHTFINAIKLYVRSVFDALNERDISKIKFADYEL